MVITKLCGGLGNQMFQYATGLALADRLNTSIIPDISWFDEMKTNPYIITRRTYELDVFGIKARKFSRIENISLLISKPVIFEEHGYAYQNKISTIAGNIILDGFWQNPKYFEKERRAILNAFKFPRETSSKNRLLLSEINKSLSVSIHVRRGDYVSSEETKKIHGLPPLEYYKRAAASIGKDFNNPRFFIFSDDISWCKQNLKINNDMVFVENNNGTKHYEDMRLMAACKHNILANSSFSWWGAWLNQNQAKLVYAPKKWSISSTNASDILPSEWIKI